MASIEVDPKKLLEAGAHFGHKTSRWHPAMRPYIHSKRAGNHIIDLTLTAPMLETALTAITKAVAGGGKILLVSTKRQAVDVITLLAEETKMPYVVNRWLGGMLTNQNTIGERVKHLKKLEERMATGELQAKYSKLEVQRFQEEIDEMNILYGGIKDLSGKPAVLFIVDILHDKNAVAEAEKLHIPVVGLVDTNGDPRTITYPVPCNDDAVKAVELVCDYVKRAIELGKSQSKTADVPQDKSADVPKTNTADISTEKTTDDISSDEVSKTKEESAEKLTKEVQDNTEKKGK